MELSNEQVFLAIAIDVVPTGRSVTGTFDPDRHTGRWNSAALPVPSPPPTSNVESNNSVMACLFP
jgi:hypothetical protein